MSPLRFDDCERCIDAILARLGKRIVLGTPLGIGKPNALLNALYRRAKADSAIDLEIVTALSLNPPLGASELEERFLAPVRARVWPGYPRLEYLDDMAARRVPANVRISEFYFKSGSALRNARAQQEYISSNYTHVARDMQARGINLLLQAVSQRGADGSKLSLSANPDVTLQAMPELRAAGRPMLAVAQVNRRLPYMVNDAEVADSFFDMVVDNPVLDHLPFAVPHDSVGTADWAIGLRASALVRDGGTLQVGIGAIGDAVCHALRLRERDNAAYRGALDALGRSPLQDTVGGDAPFAQGLYVASELVSNAVYALFEAGIVRRRVYEHEWLQTLVTEAGLADGVPEHLFDVLWERGALPAALDADLLAACQRHALLRPGISVKGAELHFPDGRTLYNDLSRADVRAALNACTGRALSGGIAMHGAFFIGPGEFYRKLDELSEERRALIGMTSVAEVNRIFTNYRLERAQRRHARFINITMKATALGAAVSDQLADGQVVSGVGGQYNFVSMAHQLPEGRSILLLRATRGGGESLEPNVVWEYPHNTIPRHLRDVFVTEYGVADLRGRTDRECLEAMIAISDSRYQDALVGFGTRTGKLPAGWQVPQAQRNNLPEHIEQALAPLRKSGALPALPFGSDLTASELALAGRLKKLKDASASWGGRLRLAKALLRPPPKAREDVAFALQHLQLAAPKDDAEWRLARLVRAAHAL